MCCSAWPVAFSKTITGTWEVSIDGRINHVLFYQNRVGRGQFAGQVFEVIVRQALDKANWREMCAGPMQVNNITERQVLLEVNRRLKALGRQQEVHELPGAEIASAGNCLIIPLLGSWESIRLLNTTSTPNLLFDLSTALEVPTRAPVALSLGYGAAGGGIIFLKFDIYDIVLAQYACDIPAVLPQIVAEKRPAVNDSVFQALDDWYHCPVAVCCFNNDQSGESKPLAFAFEPLYPDNIVIYTLDGHDGKPPVADAMVDLDHTIFVGSYRNTTKNCAKVNYSDAISADLRPYILNHVMGTHVSHQMENGDFLFETKAVRSGHFEGLRTLPPRAPAGLPRLGHTIRREDRYIHN